MQRGVRVCDLIGPLTPGFRPLEGKSFYLDEVKSRPSGVITEIIGRLGGKVESFLHKDVSVVVTGNREALTDAPPLRSPAVLERVQSEVLSSPRVQRTSVNNVQRPGTPRPPVCGSRGKALLEKVIRNNERSQGGVLTNARSWGVKIVGVDDFLKFVDKLTVELSTHKKRNEKKVGESSVQRIVKAGVLKAEFLKVEDSCRKYRPLHAQSLSFPMLSYTGRFSPFEPPAPPKLEKRKEEELSKDKLWKSEEPVSSCDKPSAPHPRTPSPRRPRKKSLGYCECCHVSYKDQEEHLQSDVHRHFVEDVTNYAVVDQLVAGMSAVFSRCPEPKEDRLLMRLLSCSPSPLSPSVDTEQQIQSETERATQAILSQGSDQLLASLRTGIVNVKEGFDLVCDPPLQPQEAVVDVSPQSSIETKPVEEKVNIHLLLEPKSETVIPSPCSKDISCATPDNEPLEEILNPDPHTLQRVGSDGLVDSITKDVPEVYCVSPCPSPETAHKPKLKEDLTTCLNSPKPQLSDSHGGTVMIVENTELSSNVNLTEMNPNPERAYLVDSLCSASSHLSIPSLCMNLSANVNPIKRSRSFNMSPKPSKKIRTSQWSGQWSDPTDKSSTSNAMYNHAPFIHSGLPYRQRNVAEKHETNCTEIRDSVECKFDTSTQNLAHYPLSAMLPCTLTTMSNTENGKCGNELHPNEAKELKKSCVVAAIGDTGDVSSELGPPQLYPFFLDDIHQQTSFPDPPKLYPAVPFSSPSKKVARPSASQASSASLLSQSFSSVCIESALIPDITFSPTSSESDWDSGLLSRLAPPGHLQPARGACELDLGLLLQRSCAGVQDGSYASQLCSVLQPNISSSTGFGETVNLNTLYRPIETMDRRIIQSLGV